MQVLRGKGVVVTGASAGIGAELCRQLGDHGCRVVLSARREDRLKQVAAEVRERGGETWVLPCDVGDRSQVLALADRARESLGEIDIWVSNAGAGLRHRALEATEEDMLWLYRVNCLSSLWAYQAVVPRWIEQGRGGHVIDVNSMGGKTGFALGCGYCAAKHAMSGMGDALRQELIMANLPAQASIHLTTVYPSLTESEFQISVIDRTGDGTKPSKTRRRRGWLMRKFYERQSAAFVARRIVEAIKRPVPFVYPNRWPVLGVLLYNLAPRPMLRLMGRVLR